MRRVDVNYLIDSLSPEEKKQIEELINKGKYDE
jgi:hypothetical protein